MTRRFFTDESGERIEFPPNDDVDELVVWLRLRSTLPATCEELISAIEALRVEFGRTK